VILIGSNVPNKRERGVVECVRMATILRMVIHGEWRRGDGNQVGRKLPSHIFKNTSDLCDVNYQLYEAQK